MSEKFGQQNTYTVFRNLLYYTHSGVYKALSWNTYKMSQGAFIEKIHRVNHFDHRRRKTLSHLSRIQKIFQFVCFLNLFKRNLLIFYDYKNIQPSWSWPVGIKWRLLMNIHIYKNIFLNESSNNFIDLSAKEKKKTKVVQTQLLVRLWNLPVQYYVIE